MNTLIDVLAACKRWEQAGEIDLAVAAYQSWLETHRSPSDAVIAFNLGVLLRNHSINQAVDAYDLALSLNPMLWQASVNKGLALEAQNRQDLAVKVWQGCMPSVEWQTTALNHLGRVFEGVKRYARAESYLMRSLMLDPYQTDVIQHYIGLRRRQCKWPIVPFWLKELRKDDALEIDCGPFMGLAHLEDPALQRQASQRFVNLKTSTDIHPLPLPPSWSHKKLRIGYFSADFKNHAVSILMAEVFELHDRERVQVFGLDYSETTPSSLRERVLKAFDTHVPLQELTDLQIAKRIRECEIDVLIDLTGLTAGSRWQVLSHRPAILQVGYLGFMGPSCISGLDAILVDRQLMPLELTSHFDEKPLYLECYQANDRQRQIGPPMSRAECNLPKEGFVFCAFNNNYKFGPQIWKSWMKILRTVPDSVLWILRDNEWAAENLRNYAKNEGIAVERLIFADRVSPSKNLSRLACADLFLDTAPYGAGTTASDALWVGLPVLTCPGRTMVSRMASSLLIAVDLPELIVDSMENYEKKAVELAMYPATYRSLRQRLIACRHSCLLFDTPKFVSNLEDVLIEAHQKILSIKNISHCDGNVSINNG